MKATNDHFKHGRDRWHFNEETVIYLTADDGSVWEFRSAAGGGLDVRAIGSEIGHDQITVRPICSNSVHMKSGVP
jgi:hypothetical protein